VEALERFRNGRLGEAIEACSSEVKRSPGLPDPRDLLSQLLCFRGEFEKADRHLDALARQFPDREKNVALIRQLLRGAEARQQFYDDGRLPEFVEQPPEYLQKHLQASIAAREGDAADAARLLAEAAEVRPRVGGRCDGTRFGELRDPDDLTACFFEALTTNGKYYWIPFERVIRVLFNEIQSPIDVLWRPAQIQVRGGPTGVLYLPQLYVDSARSGEESLQLGLETDWRGGEGEPVRGVGHRILRIDGDMRPMANVRSFEFDGPSKAESPT